MTPRSGGDKALVKTLGTDAESGYTDGLFGSSYQRGVSTVFQCMEHVYSIGSTLGKGTAGTVRVVKQIGSGRLYACKTIPTGDSKCAVREIQGEVDAMTRAAGHANIVALHEVVEGREATHLVLDLCSGGDLYGYLSASHGRLETTTAFIFWQVADALAHCHARGVVHGDVKPENILLLQPTESSGESQRPPLVKLADFGSAACLEPGGQAVGLVGSAQYVAPEVARKQPYGAAADMWSLGISIFGALTGRFPFGKMDGLLHGEKSSDPSQRWSQISPDAKDLMHSLLQMDPSKRPSAAEVLRHPWIVNHHPPAVFRAPGTSLRLEIEGLPCPIPTESTAARSNRQQVSVAHLFDQHQTERPRNSGQPAGPSRAATKGSFPAVPTLNPRDERQREQHLVWLETCRADRGDPGHFEKSGLLASNSPSGMSVERTQQHRAEMPPPLTPVQRGPRLSLAEGSKRPKRSLLASAPTSIAEASGRDHWISEGGSSGQGKLTPLLTSSCELMSRLSPGFLARNFLPYPDLVPPGLTTEAVATSPEAVAPVCECPLPETPHSAETSLEGDVSSPTSVTTWPVSRKRQRDRLASAEGRGQARGPWRVESEREGERS
eukprot:TRINITY_DN19105_c0_g1_i1.p1 TRINITY_DN19105_c0_g1~~TRINITY_DN19105_c0_g1_i1.p1  ORF type:complete len:608 (-),score=69.31 TRINITY_DN19105_c0_g1_i1:259-2082(-)